MLLIKNSLLFGFEIFSVPAVRVILRLEPTVSHINYLCVLWQMYRICVVQAVDTSSIAFCLLSGQQPRPGRSVIVAISTPLIMTCSFLYSSQTSGMPFSIISTSSSITGSRNTSMSFPGYLGPWISSGIWMYDRFIQT